MSRLDVRGGPHDGAELVLEAHPPLGSEVVIVTDEKGAPVGIGQVVVGDPLKGDIYVVRGWGLEFSEHREEKAS